MRSNFIDLTGKRFGRLIVKKLHYSTPKRKYWLCQCNCGNEKIIVGDHLSNGNTRSCGCLLKEFISKLNFKHGDAINYKASKEHAIWSKMKSRCYNINDYKYKIYGARGIRVCERWLNNYINFLYDMGRCPTGCSIDRIDVNGDYSPDNCRWADAKTQAENTRRNVWLEFRGIKKIESQWADEWGIDRRLFNRWYKKGLNMEQIYNKKFGK